MNYSDLPTAEVDRSQFIGNSHRVYEQNHQTVQPPRYLTKVAAQMEAKPQIELSDAELVEIVGGAYLRAINTIPVGQMSKITPNFTIGEENCGPGSCHSACNSWCHNWCNDTD